MIHYLLADIGGTNSNFALLEIKNKKSKIILKRKFETKQTTDFNILVNNFLNEIVEKKKLLIINAVIAVAGKIDNTKKQVKLSNFDMIIDIKQLQKKTSLKNIEIINDFTAIAYAIKTLKQSQIKTLNKGKKQDKKPITIIGAGTGLGKSTLYYNKEKKQYLPKESEAGHQDIAINNKQELELINFIKKELNKFYIEYEDIISGRGIKLIYKYLTNISKSAEQISKNKKKDKSAKQTFEILYKFYGRFAKNCYLDSISDGGIYLAGGIIEKNLDIPKKLFLEEFTNNNLFKTNLKKVQINIIKNYDISIQGLINYINKDL